MPDLHESLADQELALTNVGLSLLQQVDVAVELLDTLLVVVDVVILPTAVVLTEVAMFRIIVK